MKKFYPSKIIGIYFLIIGLIILLKILFVDLFKSVHIILVVLSIASLDLTVRGFILRKRSVLIIPGIISLLTSLFFLTYIFIDPEFYYFRKFWPILGTFPALSLVFYYLRSLKKRAAIIVPGIFLLFLSIILLLFTNEIINLKFTTFLLLLIPSMIILTGLYLIFRNELEVIKKRLNKNQN